MKLSIVGCHSATPRRFHNPTSQVLELRDQVYLIDCGEGTQVQLRRFGIKFTRFSHIFISHLHGDHFYGLIGLISTFSLLKRTQPLTIHGPKGIREVIELQLRLSNSYMQFQLHFNELSGKEPQVVLDNDTVTVTTIPLKHRVYTNGYLFKEKVGQRVLDYPAAVERGVDMPYYNKAKQGHDVPGKAGVLISNTEVTKDPPEPWSYAFCSDTMYLPQLHEQIMDVDVLYHESTFTQKEAHLLSKTKHSTAAQAAQVAHDARAGQLILGHYSTRYTSKQPFLDEAQPIFGNVVLARDGRVFHFDPHRKIENHFTDLVPLKPQPTV